jgi:hypothetical protein
MKKAKTVRVTFGSGLVRHVARSLGMKLTHREATDWLARHENEFAKAIHREVYGPGGLLEAMLERTLWKRSGQMGQKKETR